MAETRKARARREREGWFEKYTPSHIAGIDIGYGSDPLNHTFRRWDLADGDATHMHGIPDETFPVVYASHVLEHLEDPLAALRNWFRILRPGGYLIVVVPHVDLYEKRRELPSIYNPEHKSFFLPEGPAIQTPPHVRGLQATIEWQIPEGEIVHVRTLDEGYIANGNDHAGGEYSIEAIVRKQT